MNKTIPLKYALGGLFAAFVLFNIIFSGKKSTVRSSSDSSYSLQKSTPTTGLATIVKETEPNVFKIEDEKELAKADESIIIAKYLDNTVDTFTLAQAKLISSDANADGRSKQVVNSAGGGFFWFFMFPSMGRSHVPRAGSYVNQNAYNKANNTAGARVRQAQARSTRSKPSSSKSGYGSSKSSKSYGG